MMGLAPFTSRAAARHLLQLGFQLLQLCHIGVSLVDFVCEVDAVFCHVATRLEGKTASKAGHLQSGRSIRG